jgi:large subunit ribosomal protein L32
MATPRRRHCPSRRDRARAHKYLEASSTTNCQNCGALVRPHQVCDACGTYKGRSYKVIVTS